LSLENYGVVLVSGKDEYGYNRLVTNNRRGTPFASDSLQPLSATGS
jgi:hypothetical protein